MVRARHALVCVLIASCNPNAFEPYQRTAPIRVHGVPDNYEQPNYGSQLGTLTVQENGQSISSIFASAGASTPITIQRSFVGNALSESGVQSRCHETGECPGGGDIGQTVIPFATWAASSSSPNNNCVFAPSNSVLPWSASDARLGGEAFVLCEDVGTVHFAMSEAFLAARGSDTSGSLRFSGFGLPSAHPLGVVIYGAYAVDNHTGERRGGGVYLQQDVDVAKSAAPLALPIPLIDPSTKVSFAADTQAGDLGAQVAGSFDKQGKMLLAVAQPSKQRVLVAQWDPSLPGMPIDKFQLRACIDAPDASIKGFGERLLVADVTGDGAAEVFIGNDPVNGVMPGQGALFMYPSSGLPDVAGSTCSGWTQPAVSVSCQDADGVACANSGFGASLAVGDVDADGVGDLIVGAPLATVGNVGEAGAVWLLPGSTSGLVSNRSSALTTDAHPKAHLGAAVAAVHSNNRDEPVASAPGQGQGEVLVFMCSPLETGYGAASLCLK